MYQRYSLFECCGYCVSTPQVMGHCSLKIDDIVSGNERAWTGVRMLDRGPSQRLMSLYGHCYWSHCCYCSAAHYPSFHHKDDNVLCLCRLESMRSSVYGKIECTAWYHGNTTQHSPYIYLKENNTFIFSNEIRYVMWCNVMEKKSGRNWQALLWLRIG